MEKYVYQSVSECYTAEISPTEAGNSLILRQNNEYRFAIPIEYLWDMLVDCLKEDKTNYRIGHPLHRRRFEAFAVMFGRDCFVQMVNKAERETTNMGELDGTA